MINFTLLKQGIKNNYKLFLIFTLLLILYITTIISMYDPDTGSALEEFAKAMPEMMKMVGMSGIFTNLIEFMSIYLYGFLLMLVPTIFTIIISMKLINKHVDKGSMTYLLASPNSRKKVAITQAKVQIAWIFLLITLITILEILSAVTMFPGELDIKRMLMLNLGLLSLHIMIGGLCFFASCTFNEPKNAYIFGAGIPLVSFMMQLVINMGGAVSNLKYICLFSLFDPNGLISFNINAIIMLIVMIIIGIIFYILSITIFNKKDLHI